MSKKQENNTQVEVKPTISRDESFNNAEEYARELLEALDIKNIEIKMVEQPNKIGNVTHEHYIVFHDGKRSRNMGHLQPRVNHIFKCRMFKPDGVETISILTDDDKKALTQEFKELAEIIQVDIQERRKIQSDREQKAKE